MFSVVNEPKTACEISKWLHRRCRAHSGKDDEQVVASNARKRIVVADRLAQRDCHALQERVFGGLADEQSGDARGEAFAPSGGKLPLPPRRHFDEPAESINELHLLGRATGHVEQTRRGEYHGEATRSRDGDV